MKKVRTRHNAAFKANVALAAVQEQESVAEIARRHKLHTNLVYKWKRQLLDRRRGRSKPMGGTIAGREQRLILLRGMGST